MTRILHTLIDVHPLVLKTPAVTVAGQTFRYGHLLNAVHACAGKLQAAKIKAGDRIATVEPNTLNHVIMLLALWSIKAVACPLSTRLPARALNSQLRQIRAKRMTSSHFIDPATLSFPAQPVHDFIYAPCQAGTILFTSGTGARPKAVLHTLGNHVASAQGANACIPLGPGERWLLSLPLYHVGGLGILFRCLLAKAAVVIPNANDSLPQSLAVEDVTHLSLVPTQLFRLFSALPGRRRFKRLKAILIGGGPIPPDLLSKSVAAGLPVYTTYGMTEMASQIATARYPLPATVLPKRKVKISTEGEILVKGETLCAGYVSGSKVNLPVDNDGWFATGDLGTLDRQGHLTVIGRRDNMFISGGENIQPEEIERCLNNFDAVGNSLVVPQQSEEFGFRPVAFIQGKMGRLPRRADLNRYLPQHLPKFKIPEQFYIWPDHSPQTELKLPRKYLAEIIRTKKHTLQEIQ